MRPGVDQPGQPQHQRQPAGGDELHIATAIPGGVISRECHILRNGASNGCRARIRRGRLLEIDDAHAVVLTHVQCTPRAKTAITPQVPEIKPHYTRYEAGHPAAACPAAGQRTLARTNKVALGAWLAWQAGSLQAFGALEAQRQPQEYSWPIVAPPGPLAPPPPRLQQPPPRKSQRPLAARPRSPPPSPDRSRAFPFQRTRAAR